MAKITAAEAGRRGGLSRSAKKLEACRKNGFQPCKVETETEHKQTPALFAPKAGN